MLIVNRGVQAHVGALPYAIRELGLKKECLVRALAPRGDSHLSQLGRNLLPCAAARDHPLGFAPSDAWGRCSDADSVVSGTATVREVAS